MNYTEIVDLALAYADRPNDSEVTANVDNYILLVESRINRKLKVSDMSARSVVDLTTTDPDQEYFQLPDDFGGLRDIEVNVDGGSRRSATYVNPEQMNSLTSNQNISNASTAKIYYSIVARQIQIFPAQQNGFLEIIYYQRIMNLNSTDPNNWISDEFPDVYIHGIVQEISAFVKDGDAFKIWKARFDEALDEIHVEDAENRWSGTPLTTKVG